MIPKDPLLAKRLRMRLDTQSHTVSFEYWRLRVMVNRLVDTYSRYFDNASHFGENNLRRGNDKPVKPL